MDAVDARSADPSLTPRKQKQKRKRTKTKVLEAAVSRHFAVQFRNQIEDLTARLNEAKAEANARVIQALREAEDHLRPAVTEAENTIRCLYAKLGLPEVRVRLYVLLEIPGTGTPVGLNSAGPARSLIVEQSAEVRDLQKKLRLVLAQRDAAETEVLEAMEKARTIREKRAVLKSRGITEEVA